MNKFRHLAWFIPLLLYSSDALAWGLYTHVYFAQQLLWAVPLADIRFRRAVRAFPGWVMAGACLPDLSLTGQHAGTHDFKQTHQWDTARRLLEQASCDEELPPEAIDRVSVAGVLGPRKNGESRDREKSRQEARRRDDPFGGEIIPDLGRRHAQPIEAGDVDPREPGQGDADERHGQQFLRVGDRPAQLRPAVEARQRHQMPRH